MASTPEWIKVTLKVVQTLEALGVPYFLGGSGASIIYGVVRATLDADLIADLKVEQIEQFAKALADEFYVEPQSMRDAIDRRSSFNLIHQETMFKVDIFILKTRLFDQAQLARRVDMVVVKDPERKAWIASAEDTILAKLEWYRLGNEVSERQWRDVLGVLKTQAGQLDVPYMLNTAESLRVVDLLNRALEEAAKE